MSKEIRKGMYTSDSPTPNIPPRPVLRPQWEEDCPPPRWAKLDGPLEYNTENPEWKEMINSWLKVGEYVRWRGDVYTLHALCGTRVAFICSASHFRQYIVLTKELKPYE